MEHARRNVEGLKGDLIRERFGVSGLPAVLSRFQLVSCLAELGEFAEGVTYADDALRIAESVGQPYSLAAACAAARIHLAKGDTDRAVPPLERALMLCETWNFPFLFPTVAVPLGSAYASRRRVVESLSLLERAVELAPRGVFMKVGESSALMALGEAYLLGGRLDEARAAAGRSLALAQESRAPGQQAWSLRLLGEIAAHWQPPDAEEAEGHHRQAMRLGKELGMRPLVAHCHLGLGELYRRTGKREQATEHLATATSMYRDMDMGFWLEKAEAEMKELLA